MKGQNGHSRCAVAELGVVRDGSNLWILETVFELGRGKPIIKGPHPESKCKREAVNQIDSLKSSLMAVWYDVPRTVV